jgi:uncharacterized protein with PQ loop repeat
MEMEQKTTNKEKDIKFPTFCWRIIAVYMVVYFIAGLISQIYYKSIWDSGAFSLITRPMNSPLVAFGPSLQFVNAFFISIVLFPIRGLIINKKNGWLTLFLLFAGFSIFVPQSASPGSFEGFLYTKLTLFEHLIGLPETLIFSLLFSVGLFQWYKNPKKIWNIVSIILVLLIILFGILGYLAAIGVIKQ